MSSTNYDAHWLYDLESRLNDAFAARNESGDLRMWCGEDVRSHIAAHRIGVSPDAKLTKEELAGALEELKACAAGAPMCIDVYGDDGANDELCLELGLKRALKSDLAFTILQRDTGPGVPVPTTEDTALPPAGEVSISDWPELVAQTYGNDLTANDLEYARAEAQLPFARFYGARIGPTWVAGISRYDLPDVSQVASLYTDPAFRNTGFAKACALWAIGSSPNQTVLIVSPAGVRAVDALTIKWAQRDVRLNLRRRYVPAAE